MLYLNRKSLARRIARQISGQKQLPCAFGDAVLDGFSGLLKGYFMALDIMRGTCLGHSSGTNLTGRERSLTEREGVC